MPYARFPLPSGLWSEPGRSGHTWPPWCVETSDLARGHPPPPPAPHQAASAAAGLNNSLSLVYSSLPDCERLSKPRHSPHPGPAALASTRLQRGHQKPAPGLGRVPWPWIKQASFGRSSLGHENHPADAPGRSSWEAGVEIALSPSPSEPNPEPCGIRSSASCVLGAECISPRAPRARDRGPHAAHPQCWGSFHHPPLTKGVTRPIGGARQPLRSQAAQVQILTLSLCS